MMSSIKIWWCLLLLFLAHIHRIHSQDSMVVQSCVKDISVSNLNGPNSYPTNGSFFIDITVNGAETPTISTNGIILDEFGNGTSTEIICFDFDTETTTTIISYNPIRGKSITFELMGDATNYGKYSTTFPNPSTGSDKSVFRRDTNKNIFGQQFEGTISYSLYHQIS